MRRLTMSAAILLAGTTGALSETLTDALIKAYNNSQLLEQNRALLRAADEGVAQSVAALRPVLAFVADASIQNVSPSPTFGNSTNTSASISLQASMDLYDGGNNRLAIEGAKESVLSTRAQLLGLEQNVLLSAVVSYNTLRSATENLRLAQSNVRLSAEQLRAARDRFEVGEVTRTDVSQAESALARAQSQEVSARGSVLQAQEAYRAEIGGLPSNLMGVPRVPQLPNSLDAARKLAQRNHPTITAAQHDVAAAEILVSRAKTTLGPSVTGTAGLSAGDTGRSSASLSLQLQQTLYAGGALKSALRQASANRDAARSSLLRSTQIVEQGVGDAWTGLAVARAQIEATDKQIRAAQLAFDGTREEARLGARTTLDVLDAQQDLLDAQTARVDAEAALFNSYYVVLQSVGLLTVDHLGLGIPTYDPAAYYNAVKTAPVRSVQGEKLDRIMKSLGKN
ncbi:TolC family outer membrane protein [Actibacterium mucosum]|nr:TolC family outer membrane protein [Actibacterium mucosum]